MTKSKKLGRSYAYNYITTPKHPYGPHDYSKQEIIYLFAYFLKCKIYETAFTLCILLCYYQFYFKYL